MSTSTIPVATLALGDLVRQMPTDIASASALSAALARNAPGNLTLTSANYQAVLVRRAGRAGRADLLTYSGPVTSTRHRSTSRDHAADLELLAFTSPDGLHVECAGRPGDVTAGAYAQEQRSQRELDAAWESGNASQLAHQLGQAILWLHQIVRCHERFESENGEKARQQLRVALNTLSVRTLDPTVRHVGRRLADGWSGTTTELLDTVAAVAARES